MVTWVKLVEITKLTMMPTDGNFGLNPLRTGQRKSSSTPYLKSLRKDKIMAVFLLTLVTLAHFENIGM